MTDRDQRYDGQGWRKHADYFKQLHDNSIPSMVAGLCWTDSKLNSIYRVSMEDALTCHGLLAVDDSGVGLMVTDL